MAGARLVTARGRVKVATRLLGAALASGLPAAPAAGQPGNAADWYLEAFDRLEAVGLTDAEWEALRNYRPHSGGSPSPAARHALARLQPVFSAVHKASREGTSDFGLDFGQGFDLRLPHLGELRRISTLMSKDAMVRLHDGDATSAARSVSAMYHMAGHLGTDGVIISSLVAQSIFTSADRLAEVGFDQAVFGPGESAVLLEAVRAYDPDDPFDVVGAIANEQHSVVGWIREKYADAEDRAWMLDELQLDVGVADTVATLMLLEEGQFQAALDQADAALNQIVEIFQLDDPGEAKLELQRLQEEVDRGEHGAVAMLMIPNYEQLYERMLEARDQVSERAAVLQAIVDGILPPGALANAAVWYLRAVHMIEELPEEVRQRFRHDADDRRRRPPDDESARAFARAAQIVDTLRIASQQERCSFEFAAGMRPGVVPWYLEGLRDAAKLLRAEALRHLHAGEPQGAADRLAIAFRLTGHLSQEPDLFTSLTAHVIFDATTDLALWGADAMGSEQRAQLHAAARRMPLRDPFGYQRATTLARRDIVVGLRLDDDARRRAVRSVRRLTPKQLLYLLVIVPGEQEPVPSHGPLDDVLDLATMRRARAARPQLMPTLAGGDLGLSEVNVPDLGRVDERIELARTTVRTVLQALEAAP